MAEYIVKTNKDGNIPFTSSGVKIFKEIIRCRDCGLTKRKFEVCKTFVEHGCDPNGFCAWADRDE